VAIFDEFAGIGADRDLLADVKAKFEKEGYDVTVYEDPTEDGGPGNTATLDTFRKMAKASTIIIDSHGQQFGWVPAKSCQGKGLIRDDTFIDSAGAKSEVQSQLACSFVTPEPVLQVEWFQTPKQQKAAYKRYIRRGISPQWITANMAADTFLT